MAGNGKFLDRFASILEGINAGLQTSNKNQQNPIIVGNTEKPNDANNSKWLIIAFIVGGLFIFKKFL